MPKRLGYYSHRFRNPNPSVQAENLRRAADRLAYLAPAFLRDHGIVLWAPWIGMARAGVSEQRALSVIYPSVAACDVLVEDFDGKPESAGMFDERNQAIVGGKQIIEVGK